jgi:hypothetical protein
MKAPVSVAKSGFSIKPIIASAFILFGAIVLVELAGIEFAARSPIITSALKYGTAAGSIIGGIFMLFRKKEKAPQIKI